MKRFIAVLFCFVLSSSFSFAIWPKKEKEVIPEFGSRGMGIFPQPRKVTSSGDLIAFTNPAIVVPVSLQSSPIVNRTKAVMAELGIKDIPVMNVNGPIWKHDFLIYIAVNYPNSPIIQEMRQRDFKEKVNKLGRETYLIHSSPSIPKQAIPNQVFVVGMSRRSLFYGVEGLRQIFEFHNKDKELDYYLFPNTTIVDYPQFQRRGVALEEADVEVVRDFLKETSVIKINSFLDLHNPKKWTAAEDRRMRQVIELTRGFGMEYIAVAPGINGDFSTAELLKMDARINEVIARARSGAQHLVILENGPAPQMQGVTRGINYNPVDQQVIYYRKLRERIKQINPDIKLSFWPRTDVGVPGDSKNPVSWYDRSGAKETDVYRQRIQKVLKGNEQVVWRGPAIGVAGKTKKSKRQKTLNRFLSNENVLIIDPSISWQAQAFKPFQPLYTLPVFEEGCIFQVVKNDKHPAPVMPTLYSAADYLWNPDGYKPDDAYFTGLVNHVAGSAETAYNKLVNNYIRPYSNEGAFINPESFLRSGKSIESIESALEELHEIQAVMGSKISGPYFRHETQRGIAQFINSINPSRLLDTAANGSLEQKERAFHLLSILQSPSATARLIPMLENPNLRVQLGVAGVLLSMGKAGDEPINKIKRYLNSSNDDFRSLAISQLAHDTSNKYGGQLTGWYNSATASLNVRLAAAYVLATKGDAEKFDFLLDTLYVSQVSEQHFNLTLKYVQRLAGIQWPVPYISAGQGRAEFKNAYQQIIAGGKTGLASAK